AFVEKRARMVEPFFDVRGVGAVANGDPHLFAGVHERSGDHFDGNRIDFHARSRTSEAISTLAFQPGATNVQLSACSTSAGPRRTVPAESAERSYTGTVVYAPSSQTSRAAAACVWVTACRSGSAASSHVAVTRAATSSTGSPCAL